MIELSSARRAINDQGVCPCCLTIAGSDSGGNAGVQADLRTFHAHGIHGCTAFTALTAQNPDCVSAIHPVPADFVAAQLDAIFGVYSVAALKTGMLGSAETVETIGEILHKHHNVRKVVDPVMIATSGAKLIPQETISALEALLIPIADVITPNIPEAEILAGREIKNELGLREVAKKLYGQYGCKVLLKGGHNKGKSAKDVFFDGKDFFEYESEWIENPISTHGTGCTLAAALTANLALGHDVCQAIRNAKRYVHNAIAASYRVGKNCGVLGF